MKTNHILAVILIASVGQAVASSALIKVGPQLSRAALMTTAAAGHKKTYPMYVHKRNMASTSDKIKAVAIGTAGAAAGTGCALAIVVVGIENPILGVSIPLAAIGIAAALGNLEKKESQSKKKPERDERVTSVADPLAAKNKDTESQWPCFDDMEE